MPYICSTPPALPHFMVVLNTHYQTLNVPLQKVADIVATLASENDQIWPVEQWPAMRFKEGVKVGAKGAPSVSLSITI